MPAIDPFATYVDNGTGILTHAAAVTPHDTNELTTLGICLYIGVSGDVKVTLNSGNTVTFKAVPVGFLPVRAKIVFAIGTTATDILSCW